MMDEYISREAAIKELCVGKVQGVNTIRLKLNSIPAADVKPVVKGEWICTDDDRNIWMCSVCKEEQLLEAGTPRDNNWHFCPNCGAIMKEANDE
jgi:hypothetical protein